MEERTSTEEQCFDWLEQQERLDAPNHKLDDLWSIFLNLERRDFWLRNWRRYVRKYRLVRKQVQDWSESSEICHLFRDVLLSYRKKGVQYEEKKQAKKRMAVCILSPEDEHPRIMEYSRRDLEEPDRKNSVYVEMVVNMAGGCLLRKWRCGEKMTMQMIPPRMSLDSIASA